MPRYVDSLTESAKMKLLLEDLSSQIKHQRTAIEKNNKELSKINEEVELQKLEKVKELEEEIRKIETQTRWVKSEEPALAVTPDTMLKKLNIL